EPALISVVLPALSALFVVLVSGESAYGPETCDNICRLRYTCMTNVGGTITCINFHIKDCLLCRGTKGLCADYEGDGGDCEEDPKFEQKTKTAKCTELCTLQKDGTAEAIFISSTVEYQLTGKGPYVCKPKPGGGEQ
ncbi:MAG: hypothetical protein L0Y72_21555, partial [Gemmataceae bacterium]|nr:hypothetical protein [Gemmataceae bacterium]